MFAHVVIAIPRDHEDNVPDSVFATQVETAAKWYALTFHANHIVRSEKLIRFFPTPAEAACADVERLKLRGKKLLTFFVGNVF